MSDDSVEIGPRASDRAVDDILGPPALIAGESEDEYFALLDRVRAASRPQDAIEDFYVREAVDYLWEARRYRRAEVRLIDSSSACGLWRMLNFLVPDHRKRLDLVCRWARGELPARVEVSDLLTKAGLDEAQIPAHAIATLSRHLDVLTRQRHAASHRMESLIREIERRRGGAFGPRLRAASDRVEDAEIIEMQRRLPSDGDLAA